MPTFGNRSALWPAAPGSPLSAAAALNAGIGLAIRVSELEVGRITTGCNRPPAARAAAEPAVRYADKGSRSPTESGKRGRWT